MSARDDFRMRQFGRRLERLELSLGDAHQRIARAIMAGKVADRREVGNDWQVRLELGRDVETDEAVLSPWLAVQPVSAGGLKIKVKPSIGERMAMLSPSGTIGTGSWAVRSPFDEEHPAPEGDQDVVLERGKSRLTIEDGRIFITNGKTEIELAGELVRVDGKAIALTGETLTHNEKNISFDHIHTKVFPGGGFSGPPA